MHVLKLVVAKCWRSEKINWPDISAVAFNAKFHRKLLLVAILACSFFLQSSATCRFALEGSAYICYLENVYATVSSDYIDLSGAHIGGRTNYDVTGLTNSGSTVLEELPTRIFSTFTNLQTLSIMGSGLRRVELNNCARIKTLEISGNQIPYLQSGAFRGCHTVESLTLLVNEIALIDENAFDDMPNLHTINLALNPIHEVQEYLLRYQTHLESFRIEPSVSTIHPRAFQTTSNMRSLTLQLNRLEIISAGTFTNMPYLTEISLRINSIRYIGPGAFKDLPSLETIDLGTNFITALDSSMFGTSMPRLKSLTLNANSVIAIDRNYLTKLPALQELNLSNSICINRWWPAIQSLQSEVLPYLEECFRNFGNL